jgi:cis-L-3-hydroxyproline dehydratase
VLGGRFGESFPLYQAISQESAAEMVQKVAAYRAQGYTKFQLKVGGDPNTDILRIREVAKALAKGDVLVADANTGWTQYEALRVVDAVRDVNVYLEQPCASYQEGLVVRRHTNRPVILDEVIDSLATVVEGIRDQVMDVINLRSRRSEGSPRRARSATSVYRWESL